MSFTLKADEKHLLLRTARESIRSKLAAAHPDYPKPSEKLRTPCGAFVTLRAGEELRGCIGHIAAHQALFDAVAELARSSAFADPRFPPVSIDELEEIEIEISVLTPLVRIQSGKDVVVGTHGVYLESGGRSGVLLPQVPVEQGWDRKQFLHHLCLKAGLSPGCLSLPGTRLFVFEAIIFSEKEFTGA